MASPAILKIDIIADATKALKQMGLVEDKAKGGMGLTSLGKTVAGAFGTAAIVGFGKSAFNAAQEAEVATSRLEQVFASMGDTTGEAAKAAADYASALSAQIGVEDEAIMAAQAQLATFGAVSDETARTAGVFDRATAAAADLAAAGFGSLDSNAVQLGKALQDPTKGMTALTRSGVTFTKEQKAQIKAMQESGDLLGAQKMVLAAVEGQVKGTAAATATSTDKMAVAFGEVQEQVGAKLLPVISGLADVLTRYMGLLIPIGGAILGIVVAVKAWQAATTAVKVAQEAWNVVQLAFNAIMAANPLFLVVAAVAALIAIIVVAYMRVGWFRDLVDRAFEVIKAAFLKMRDTARAVFDWLRNNWPTLLAILTGPIGVATLAIIRNWDTIKGAATAVYEWVRSKFDAIVGFFRTLGGIMSAAIGGVVTAIKLPIAAATAVYDAVTGTFDDLVGFFRGLVGTVGRVAGDIADALKRPINAFIRAWNGIELKIPSVDIPLVGKVGGQTIGLPDVPTLARGGRVLSTGLAVVHEGETFSGVGGRLGGTTTVHIHVNTTGLGAQSPDIQRAVVEALRLYTSRNGPLPAQVVAS